MTGYLASLAENRPELQELLDQMHDVKAQRMAAQDADARQKCETRLRELNDEYRKAVQTS